jgi:hypothetical protein
MDLTVSHENSGMTGFIGAIQGTKTRVPIRRIDSVLAELGIAHVDFIKMDIEGAEREALKGAARLLEQSKPRLMIDAYHLPDDPTVLPEVIRRSNPAYQARCGPCELVSGTILPHVLFFY